jgi:hypothetical protein
MSQESPIQIEVTTPEVPAGGTVRGLVRLQTVDSMSCRGVDVEIGWRTSGRGDTDKAVVHTERLHEGSIPPGGMTLEFTAELPPVPCTYHGELIKINWFARARIDRALKLDPRDDTTFIVR